MKFRFCGDLDCPDWILAEIATISKISSIKAKQLANLVSNSLINNIEIEKEKLEKLANDTKLESNDIKACVSLLEFVLKCSVKYNCNGEILSSELQQLGLPKEHSTSICKVYEDIQLKLENCLKNSSLKLNEIESISWRIDYIFGSNLNPNMNQALTNVKFIINNDQNIKKSPDSVTITLNSDKLKLLIHELKKARNLMNQYESSIQNSQ